jgi:tripartite-type tricarboxylate transporter receptor subunit TctC
VKAFKLFGAVSLAWVMLATAALAAGEAWPDHTVKFIVPFGAGAGADIGARLFAERLSTRWGKPVVVENRPGGDGFVAITAFVGANDDHTLLFAAAGSFTVHPYQHDKVPYDIRDLVLIARVSNTIITLGVPEAMKLVTLTDLFALARAQPGKLNAALVPGITEFVWDGFINEAGLNFAKVPYRDIVQAGTDLGENRIQVIMTGLAVIQAQVQAQRVRLLAVTNNKRAVSYPDVPTVVEAGFPSLELEGLVGLFGPRLMPPELRDRISADVRAVAADPAITQRLTVTAQVVNPGSPAEFAAAIDEQRAKMAKIAQRLGIKAAQ